jgi:hypothetical protein
MFIQKDKELKSTGIYRIICNKKSYIGLAMSIETKHESKKGFIGRWKRHITALNLNKHPNKEIQAIYNKKGIKCLQFEILEILKNKQKCKEREIFYIDKYKATNPNFGFNKLRISLVNYKIPNQKTREKISKSLMGKARPLYLKEKLGNPVVQYDLEMNEIARYYSVTEAAKITGISRQLIGCAANGKYKTVGGFKWKKVKDIV